MLKSRNYVGQVLHVDKIGFLRLSYKCLIQYNVRSLTHTFIVHMCNYKFYMSYCVLCSSCVDLCGWNVFFSIVTC